MRTFSMLWRLSFLEYSGVWNRIILSTSTRNTFKRRRLIIARNHPLQRAWPYSETQVNWLVLQRLSTGTPKAPTMASLLFHMQSWTFKTNVWTVPTCQRLWVTVLFIWGASLLIISVCSAIIIISSLQFYIKQELHLGYNQLQQTNRRACSTISTVLPSI